MTTLSERLADPIESDLAELLKSYRASWWSFPDRMFDWVNAYRAGRLIVKD